jgi:hypothetical protein
MPLFFRVIPLRIEFTKLGFTGTRQLDASNAIVLEWCDHVISALHVDGLVILFLIFSIPISEPTPTIS